MLSSAGPPDLRPGLPPTRVPTGMQYPPRRRAFRHPRPTVDALVSAQPNSTHLQHRGANSRPDRAHLVTTKHQLAEYANRDPAPTAAKFQNLYLGRESEHRPYRGGRQRQKREDHAEAGHARHGGRHIPRGCLFSTPRTLLPLAVEQVFCELRIASFCFLFFFVFGFSAPPSAPSEPLRRPHSSRILSMMTEEAAGNGAGRQTRKCPEELRRPNLRRPRILRVLLKLLSCVAI